MSPTKILVVDDDRNLVELLKMTLESADYEATAVLNEKDAIGAVKENMFDLSIVDLQLGQEDGIALMEAMHLLLPDMPVIILTGHGSTGG
jgi:DNA-binding NtrC family response regulator